MLSVSSCISGLTSLPDCLLLPLVYNSNLISTHHLDSGFLLTHKLINCFPLPFHYYLSFELFYHLRVLIWVSTFLSSCNYFCILSLLSSHWIQSWVLSCFLLMNHCPVYCISIPSCSSFPIVFTNTSFLLFAHYLQCIEALHFCLTFLRTLVTFPEPVKSKASDLLRFSRHTSVWLQFSLAFYLFVERFVCLSVSLDCWPLLWFFWVSLACVSFLKIILLTGFCTSDLYKQLNHTVA